MPPPARLPFPSASGGLWALGCVRGWWLSVWQCRFGSKVSRVWYPSIGGEAEAATTPNRNKSSQVLPPMVLLSSAIGELVVVVLPVWSSRTRGACRSEREMSSSTFYLVITEAALGLVVARKAEQIQSSPTDLPPGSPELWVRPRLMDLWCCLLLALDDELLLRLF